MNKNKLELLDINLIESKEFKIVNYWLKVFKAEIGWHYFLDLIWQLKEIRKMNLPPNSTIIDAGGGKGMMQFILASLGYNILSIDFNKRSVPKLYSTIFNIESETKQTTNNEYVNHLVALKSKQKKNKYISRITKILNITYIFESIITMFSPYGDIKFITADFSNLDFIADNSIDAIVSTSAIEHNDSFKKISCSIKEFERILKKDSAMLITTSATNSETWWHKPSKGYCFSEVDLIKIFSITEYKSNFDNYNQIFSNIKSSKFLKNNLPSLYFQNPNCGMPMGKWDPKYIPVGIVKYVH